MYGLLVCRRVGPGDPNPAATACAQQAFYRFVSGLCASFWRCTRICAAIGLASQGRRDVVKRFQSLTLCKSNPGGVQRQPTRSLSPDGSRYFTLGKIARTSRVRYKYTYALEPSATGESESHGPTSMDAKPTSVDILDTERRTQNDGKWTSPAHRQTRFITGLIAAKAAVLSSSREWPPLPSSKRAELQVLFDAVIFKKPVLPGGLHRSRGSSWAHKRCAAPTWCL